MAASAADVASFPASKPVLGNVDPEALLREIRDTKFHFVASKMAVVEVVFGTCVRVLAHRSALLLTFRPSSFPLLL